MILNDQNFLDLSDQKRIVCHYKPSFTLAQMIDSLSAGSTANELPIFPLISASVKALP